MQRLALLIPTRAVAAYCATSTAQRYVNKKAAEKLLRDGDNRWFEAEIDENINTPEERYAREREVEVLKKMVAQLREEQAEKLCDMKEKRDREVAELRKQMSELEGRINSMKDT